MDMCLWAVGRVHNGVHRRPEEGWREIISEIEVGDEYAPALDGVADFSHIMVLFWLDRKGDNARATLRVHPRGRSDLPEVGVFATRSPARPNPVAVSVCRLLAREGSRLRVAGLDALDGSPVLDIKSYTHRGLPRDTRAPAWMDEIVPEDGQ